MTLEVTAAIKKKKNVPKSFCPLSLDLIQLSPQFRVITVVRVFKLGLKNEIRVNYITALVSFMSIAKLRSGLYRSLLVFRWHGVKGIHTLKPSFTFQ